MTFGNLPALGVAVGLAAIAGVLYALQRLRVRHREVEVVTTKFWKELLEETRARVLTKRFRHPWAYALLVALGSLLFLAFARPQASGAKGDVRLTVLLDQSAGMARTGRFVRAKKLVAEIASAGDAEVLACGGICTPLLMRGEHPRLLRERLDAMSPDAAPPSLERVVRALIHAGGAPRRLVAIGDGTIDAEIEASLPDGWTLERVVPPGNIVASRAVVALGVTEAASGRWDRVDVFAEVTGDDAALAATVDGAPFDAAASRTEGRFVWRDVAARGQAFAVACATRPGDLEADDRATIRLPDRTPLRVRVDEALPDAVARVLAFDSGLVLVKQDADVAVVRGAEPNDVPALRFVAADEGAAAFAITAPGDPDDVLWQAFASLGLDQIDATSWAEQAGRPVTLEAETANQRGMSCWESLLDERYNFTASRSFPTFLARSLRWLATTPPMTRWARAGEPVESMAGGRWTDEAGRIVATAGAALVPPRAGVYRSGDRVVAASLTTPAWSAVRPSAARQTTETERTMPLWTWLLLGAAALVVADWYLFGTGRMP